ncbi:hypothetical protein [Alteribacter natronophilus]|uniref:hypothetical protein n=1 Tax=Alteribacter natronophilus TaxID=2583810 RepID=UPI00110E5505|nr:hypothetical protein [Alteribacter natronophilus]TMW73475.1 hypothetical protein FGB90_04025 [Alteribacter natronophilus]
MDVRVPAVCIAVDIKNSSLLNKTELLESLNLCRSAVNKEFASTLLVKAELRGGDELVAVSENIGDTRHLMETVRLILGKNDLPFYMGVGIGFIENAETSIHTVNGSAVLNAMRARDDELKSSRQSKKESSFYILSEEVPDSSLNSMYLTILEKKKQWTAKQQDVIDIIEKHPEWTFEQAGKKLGYKSPKSAVSYLLARSQYARVKGMEEAYDELTRFYQDYLQQKAGCR